MALAVPEDTLILKELDINYPSLGSPILDNLKKDYLDRKSLNDDYRSKKEKLRKKKSVLGELFFETKDPVIASYLGETCKAINELDSEYSNNSTLFKIAKYNYSKSAHHLIEDTPNITGVIIDKFKPRFYLFDYGSRIYNLLTKSSNLDIHELGDFNILKDWLNPYMPDYDPQTKTFLDPNNLKTLKSYLYYHLIIRLSDDYKKYGLIKPPYEFYRKETKTRIIKLEFESGLKIDIKKEITYGKNNTIVPLFTIPDFNVITYARSNKCPYNFILKQNNYKAYTECLNRFKSEITDFYNLLFPDGESGKIPFGLNIKKLLIPDYSKTFYIDYPELHINLIHRDKRELLEFHKTLLLIGGAFANEYRNIERTHYFGGKTYPETKAYDKPKQIKDLYDYELGVYSTRLEVGLNKLSFVKKAFASLNPNSSPSRSSDNAHYYHPDNSNYLELSSRHKEVEFNQFINSLYYHTCIYSNLIDLINYVKNSSGSKIIDDINSNDDLKDILYCLSTPKTTYDLLEHTQLNKSTLDRRLSKLKGLVVYNPSTKKYQLTILGGLVLNDYSSLLRFYHYFKKSLSLSNTLDNQTSLSCDDISSFLYPILDYLLKPKIIELSGGDPSGT